MKNKRVRKSIQEFLTSKLFWGFRAAREREYFVENLSALMDSGIDIVSAISAIETEIKTKKMKEAIYELKEDIESGSFLWKAFQRTNLLPSHIVFLIKLGEETGKLPENLSVIAIQQQKDREIKSRLRSAMIYPAIVFFLTLVVGLGITWFVLPRLAQVFRELKVKLPFLTEVVIGVGNFLGNYGSVVVPILIILGSLVFYFLFFFSKTKHLGQATLWKLPGIGNLIRDVELSRMGYVLGTLLKSGVEMTYALDSIKEATGLRVYQVFYTHLRSGVEEGNSFRESFDGYKNSSKLIPLPMQQMIVAGEDSGRLAESLLKIGEIFGRKIELTTKNMAVILEPVLLVIVWIGVVLVALAVILPIYSLIGGLTV